MKAPVNPNQISNSVIIYYMLQFTFLLNDTARVEVAGCQVLQCLTTGMFFPLLLKCFSQQFSLSLAQERDESSLGQRCSGVLATWKIIIISYKVSEQSGFI